jgi:hypothetical protein
MKTGRTLVDLQAEVERQAIVKRDALVPSRVMRVHANGATNLQFAGADWPLSDRALWQLGAHLTIPWRWMEQLRAHHEDWRVDDEPLFDATFNTLLDARPEKERRLVRTLDGGARAVLSDRYRPLDNLPILNAVLPTLQDRKGIDWSQASMQVTEDRLYLKLVDSKLTADVKVGDPVQAGVMVTNSEIGLGAFTVTPMLFRLICTNGMVRPDPGNRRSKIHVGGLLGSGGEDGPEAYEWLSDEAITARNLATIFEMRDVVSAAFDEAVFQKGIERAREATGVKIEGDPVKAVEWLANEYTLNEAERTGVMRSLITGGDLSLWGMVNAVTAHAQQVESYDRSTELEAVGGRLLDLPRHDLRALTGGDRN